MPLANGTAPPASNPPPNPNAVSSIVDPGGANAPIVIPPCNPKLAAFLMAFPLSERATRLKSVSCLLIISFSKPVARVRNFS